MLTGYRLWFCIRQSGHGPVTKCVDDPLFVKQVYLNITELREMIY